MSDNKLKLIQDIELDNLNDENDFLETKKYSKTLQEIIKTTHTSCTIGLFGEWGSGKSSIIRDVINKLDYNKSKQHYKDTNEKIRFVVYDAWKYSKDSFRRTFLLEMAKELKFQEQDYFDMFYANQSDEKIKRSLEVANAFVELVKAIGGGIPNPINVIEKTKITTQKPFIFAPEQFENLFDEMLEKSLGVKSIFARAVDYFKKDGYEAEINKLVIVIDNLDRCNADTVCEMLSDIKGFLNKDKVVFIVPLDDKMLKKHLEKINGYEDSESSEYLRKIFDCVLSLKKTQEFDMYEVLDKLLKNHKIEYNPNTMGVISEEYASNPRRIIKFINNFEIEKELLYKRGVDKELIKTNETLIAFLLILKEEQYNLYQKILENISNIHTIGDKNNKLVKNEAKEVKVESTEPKEEIESVENIYIKKFLEHTKVIWSKADLNVVDKVVCNLNTEDKLPYEIREKLEKNEFGKIKQEEYAEASKHLVFSFNKWCERGVYETKALSFFKQLIKANAYKMLSKNNFDDIYNKSEYALKELLEYLEDEEDIKNAIQFIKSSIDNDYIDLDFFYTKELIHNYSAIDVAKKEYAHGEATSMLAKYGEMKNIYKVGFEHYLNHQIYSQEDLEIYQEYFYTHSYFNDYKPYLNLNNEVFVDIFNEDIIDFIPRHKVDCGVLIELIFRMYRLEVISIGKACDLVLSIPSDNLANINKLEYFKAILNNVDLVDMASFNNDKYLKLLYSLDVDIELEIKFIFDKFAKNTLNDVFCHFIEQFFRLKINQEQLHSNTKNLEEQILLIHYCINNYSDFDEMILSFFIDSIGKYFYIQGVDDILLCVYGYFKRFGAKLDNKILSNLTNITSNMFAGLNGDIGKKLQRFLIKLSDNDEMKIEIINRLSNYERHFSKLTPEFKEIFLKGEQNA
ncbi:hypothetical protein AVCANL279_04880 [Campylobacter canadensis]|uniref:KAP family P-loop NTPase fold protein n=1 Tax=Campylobacter canadensis TaxID=449520 RepID=UPI001553B549|nr:P-loop NTPase fold protein [Campylobacter canadensis]MBZ7995064.1 hypothetical protein [Campylobacter canadensis]MBZ7996660.1 hypothetical protein [Campylobacter canadensis]MBZ8000268.1 hypothetical protein [Campylobacter canadensis]MBZ8002290.1 hypothetical protein [Campylobacter canadensis]MBZ8003405.1 hypothetical protein [Campylobacter canadensis]